MSDYVSQSDAEARLGISRSLFEASIRPQLTEYPLGVRAVRFKWAEIEQLMAESAASQQGEAAMFFHRRTVADALDHAWRLKWKDSKGQRKKAQLMKVCKDDVGADLLAKVDYNWLEEWVLKMRDRDNAVATIKSKVSCVLYALKLAQAKGWVKAVPTPPELEMSEGKLRYLLDDPDEEKMLLDACENVYRQVVIADVMRRVIIFLIDTGARLGELVKVGEDSITTRGVTFLDRKAGDNLTVPLTARAREAIEWLLANHYWQKRVRGCRKDHKRANSAQNWITHHFALARNKAGLFDVTAHSLRHTCASRLVQAGVDIYQVRQFLGHSSVRMTERYAHLAPSSLNAAVAVLERRGTRDKVVPFKRPER